MEPHLLADAAVVSKWIIGCAVQEVHYGGHPLRVSQEVGAETHAAVRSLQKAGYLNQNEVPCLPLNVAEHRLQCREWVRGNIRTCACVSSQQRGLSNTRHSHNRHVREKLQLQLQCNVLCRLSLLSQQGHAVLRVGEARIPLTSLASPCYQSRRAKFIQIRYQFPTTISTVACYKSPYRDSYDVVPSTPTGLVPTVSTPTVLRRESPPEPEIP